MRHSDVWRGIDRLAEQNGLSASALARLSGLDPTSFNPSKRQGKDGRLRWPSSESIARALEAVNAGMDDFAALIEGRRGPTAPLIGLAQAGADGFFDDGGFPIGGSWDEVRFPGLGDEAVYALEITGDSMEPAYREGDRIIVAPGAQVRKGDRVVAKTVDGEVMAKVLGRQTGTQTELISLNPDHPVRAFRPGDILWLARILWVSQ
jgi:phage repressor protein C with HTH and peptisase S24 domain